MDLNIFAVDHSKGDEGLWFDYDRTPGIRVKIRSIECQDYEASIERQRAKYARGMRAGVDIPKKVASDITRRSVADCLVVDWEGLTDSSGEAVNFDPTLCYQIISDERYVDFYGWILQQAADIKNFAAEEAEHIAKNSEAGCDGG